MLIMKLYTKIAGTLALPLALAVAANSAQAYTVVDTSEHKLSVGGYLSAIASWDKQGNSKSTSNNKFNNNFSAGTSRLNIGYTNKEIGTSFFYEQQFDSGNQTNGLRHAFFSTEDGWVGGHTWSFGTNLVALAETIDTTGNSLVSYQVGGPRNLLLGKKFKLDDSMTVGLAIEGKNTTRQGRNNTGRSKAPAVTANFEGNFNGIKVFTAVTNYAVNVKPVDNTPNSMTWDGTQWVYDAPKAKRSGKDKRYTRFTVGSAIPMGDATLKLGLTHNFGMTSKNTRSSSGKGYFANLSPDNAKGTHVSAALNYRVTEKIRTNLAIEASRWDKNAYAKSFNRTATANYGNNGKSSGTASRIWLNAFYQADNGIEWGAELQHAKISANQDAKSGYVTIGNSKIWVYQQGVNYSTQSVDLYDKGTAIRLQAKYAF